ncbi:hypothetical protein KBC77_00995 [Candidatus Saccharibacteria bacterium]|nr:hypothetical protein [Candidatus Saccharibacteria bacterium]
MFSLIFTGVGLFATSFGQGQSASALTPAQERDKAARKAACKAGHFDWNGSARNNLGHCDKNKCENGYLMRGGECKEKKELKRKCEEEKHRDWKNDDCTNNCLDGYLMRGGECKEKKELKRICEEEKHRDWKNDDCTNNCLDGYVMTNGQCVKKTPGGREAACTKLFRVWKDGKCKMSCINGYLMRNNVCKQESVLKKNCDDKNRIWRNDNCSKDCKANFKKSGSLCVPEGGPAAKCTVKHQVWRNGQCLEQCLVGWQWNAEQKKCKLDGATKGDKEKRDCARRYKVWDEAGKKCTNQCLAGYRNGKDGKKCVADDPKTDERAACKAAHKIWSVTGKKCTDKCENGYKLKDNACVKADPKDKQKAACEKTFHAWKDGKCSKDCMDGYRKKKNTNKCVKIKDKPTCNSADPGCKPDCDPEEDPECELKPDCDPLEDATCPEQDIDSTNPTVKIVQPYNGAKVGSKTFTVVVTASDLRDDDTAGTVTKVELSIDGEDPEVKTTAPFTFEIDPATLEDDSEYELTATAYDTADNSSEDSVTIAVDYEDVPKPPAEKTISGYDGNTVKISLDGECVNNMSANQVNPATLSGIFEDSEKLLAGAYFKAGCTDKEEGANVTIDLGKKYPEESMGLFKINSEGSVIDVTDSVEVDNTGATTLLKYGIVDGDELDSDSAENASIEDPIIITTNPDNVTTDTGGDGDYDNYDDGTDSGGHVNGTTLPNTGAGAVISGIFVIIAATVAASVYNNKFRRPNAALTAPTVGDAGFTQPLGTGQFPTEQPVQPSQQYPQQAQPYVPPEQPQTPPKEN